MSEKESTPADRWHGHLARCVRCASNPFNLCAEGLVLLHLCAPSKRGEHRRAEEK